MTYNTVSNQEDFTTPFGVISQKYLKRLENATAVSKRNIV